MKVIKLITVKILNYLIIIFLNIAELITHNIFNNNKTDCNNTKNPVHYLSQLLKNPFLLIKFSNTSTKIEKIISSLQSKNGACGGAVG
jgi:hypothetical protein